MNIIREKRDLYDANRNLTIQRRTDSKRKLYSCSFSIYSKFRRKIFNSKAKQNEKRKICHNWWTS